MNPFNALGKLNQTRSRVLPSTSSPVMISGGRIIANSTLGAATVLNNSDLFAVINLISSDVSGSLFTTKNQKNLTILNKPSKLINPFNFWQSVYAQMLIHGNAYVINWGHSLELAPSQNVTVVLDDNAAGLTYRIWFTDERPDQTFKSDKMFHFRLMPIGEDDNNQYIGVSPLRSLLNEINIQEFSNKLTLSTLKNAINPGITLTIPEGIVDRDAKNKIRTEFENQNSGENSGRAVVLDQGIELKTIQINSDVANFLKNFDFGKTQIAKAFGIPESYLNGQGDQQSSLEMSKSLYANSLQRYIKPVISELSAKLDDDIGMDIRDAVDATKEQFTNILIKLATNKGSDLSASTALDILEKNGVI